MTCGFPSPAICFLYFLPFTAAADADAVVVRPATCWSAVTIVHVKTATTNTAKTIDETRVIACDGRYHAYTWTTIRRRKPVSETRDVPAVFVDRPSSSLARAELVRPSSETQNGYRASERARACRTTCSDCRHPSPVIIISDSQTVVIGPNPKPSLTGPVSNISDEHTSPK